MALQERGWVPAKGFVERYLASVGQHDDLPSWELHRLEPLLDSANMRPSDWVRIANAIAERYDDFDGFVVLHGTDTMVYTASALSFLLRGLAKPVILTGAQLSLADIRSDGREHVITSLMLAAMPIPEVGLYFGQRLFRGNRAQKIHNHDFVAFASGNLPPLGRVGVRFDLRWDLIRPAGDGDIRPGTLDSDPDVLALRLYPGMHAAMLERVLQGGVQGVVLETYGTGTFPSADLPLMHVVEAAIERGVVVVNCSQCHSGRVNQGLYGTGRALADAGVVSGHDMTPEAALTKLYCILGSGRTPDQARALMEQVFAGEISPSAS